MYAVSYKLNNSYTTYVIRDYGKNFDELYWYRKPDKPLEWKCGSKVRHTLYGKGEIINIAKNQITVQFNDSRTFKKYKNIQVAVTFKRSPCEIDNLVLCY